MTSQGGASGSEPRQSATSDRPSLAQRVILLRRYVFAALTGGLIVGAVSLAQARTYTATASFLPIGGDARTNRLSSLASQLGIDVGSARATATPEFFAEFVRTETFRREMALRQLALPGGRRTTLVTEWGGRDSSRALDNTVKRLLRAVTVSTGPKSGLVRIDVSSGSAGLSAAAGQVVLDLVDEFNVDARRLTAASDSLFFLDRIGSTDRDLSVAEDSLGSFLRTNREYRNSPPLVFAFERLSQRVQMLRQLESSMAQAREQARIDALRTLPTIVRVEPSDAPLHGDSRGTLFRALFGAALGVIALLVFERVQSGIE